MITKITYSRLLLITVIGSLLCPSLSFALTTPAGKDNIRLYTGTPKKDGETLFSYTVTWRIDDGLTYRSSGLTFIHGPNLPTATKGDVVSKKLVIALNDAMEYLYPSWRGATVEQTKDQPGIVLSNKDKFDFTQLTFRDYSNQELSYDLLGQSFLSENVGIAIDIVYAADVENIAEFTPNKPKISTGGDITVKIDGVEKAKIKTDGKSTSQIENELAGSLSSIAKFSTTPIFPNIKDETTRNYKPFDGGEVQLLKLSANSITIDINDPSLGVLTKFDFPDLNKPADIAGNIPYIVFIGAGVIFCYFFFSWYMQSRKEEETEDDQSET